MRLKAPRFLRLKKKSSLILVVLLTVSLLMPLATHASEWLATAIGSLIGIFISALGLVLILVIKGLILIASYQDFIRSGAVTQGWQIVRDISNMFFVVILLVIAFSTILHIENYNYKKWLPKLILMAVLINFSKTICGLLIDVAQIVMLTFVNAFKDVAGGNIIDMLGIKDIVTMANDNGESDFWTIIAAYVLGLIYMIIALVVITTMMMILAMRLVMIWIYVVLSPLAYLLSAFPAGAQYASKWWKEFIQNLIVGPVLAFFIWLSFAALQTGTELNIVNTAANSDVSSEVNQISGGNDNGAVASTKASTPGALIKFVIGIGMLIGGLKIAQEIGGAAGSIAGKGMGRLNKLGAMGAGAVGGFALGRAKFVGRQALAVPAGMAKGTGILSNAITKKFTGRADNAFGRSMNNMGDIGLSYRRDLMKSNEKAKIDKRKKFLEKIGVGAGTADKINQGFGSKNLDGQSLANGLNIASLSTALGASLGGPAGAAVGLAVGTAVGGSVGYGLNKVSKSRKSKLDGAKANVTSKQEAYDTTMANIASTDAEKATAKKNLDDAKNQEKRVQGKYAKKDGEGWVGATRKTVGNWALNTVGNLNAASTEFTTAAAKKIADVDVKARQQVEVAAKDPTFMDDAAPNGFYSSNGQQDTQEAFVRHLSSGTPDGTAAIQNMTDWVGTTTGTEPQKNKLRALAKSIAATSKKGDVDISTLAPLMNAINGKAGDIGGTIESFKPSVISYRETGESGEKGKGGVYVDSFAKGKNAGGAEVVGADFEKLKASGVDISATAEGAHIGPEMMKGVADALIAQIKEEKMNLETKREGMNPTEYEAKKNSLDNAEKKLQSPDALKGLSLVNTKSDNFGRNARLTSAYHEQIHGGGVDDEELTEGLAKSLMANSLHGRNTETGVRHSQEVAALAKAMKEGGASNAAILKAMDAEISKRSVGESRSRADRVLKMESGKRETEKEFVSGNAPEVVVDLKGLETKLQGLEKTFKNIKFKDNGLHMTRLFNHLGAVIRRSDLKTQKTMNKLRPDKASTPLEIEVIDGEANQA